MQETWVLPLGREEPLEKGMTTYSSILSWEIPWTEEPGGLYIPKWSHIWRYWWLELQCMSFVGTAHNPVSS